MHQWGDEKVDWEGINDAAYYIAAFLKRWGRIGVTDYKEKFGTVRVYCHFGWINFYSLWRPGYCWYPKWWPIRLDQCIWNNPIADKVQKLIVKWQIFVYKQAYKKAVQRWPHLYNEIVSMADYGEFFEGVVPGYKHSNYWTLVKGDDNGNGECEVNEETDSNANEDTGERADVERARQRYEGSTAEDYKDIDNW